MINYRGYQIQRGLSGWQIRKDGKVISERHPDFAAARRWVDGEAGPHAEPVDDGPKDEPHYN